MLVCGYYSREVTIQEKLFCTAMSTALFHRHFYKSFQKTLGFLSLDSQDLDQFHWVLFSKKKSKVSNESLSETHVGQYLPKDVVPKLKFLVNEYIIDRNCLTQPYLVRFLKFLSC